MNQVFPVPAEPTLAQLHAMARATRRHSKASGTLRAYASCWRSFEAWCRRHHLVSMPASNETVILFLEAERQRGMRASTIESKRAAIRHFHQRKGHPSPCESYAVKEELAGIRREIGTAPVKKKAATAELVAGMVAIIPGDTLKGKRDRALLLLGFAGALRRSELVGLNVADLEIGPDGIVLTIRRSKTDQEGAGQIIGIPNGAKLRPVEAVTAWLEASGIEGGAIFRPIGKGGRLQDSRLSDRSVANLVKHYAKASGLNPKQFSGQSLRSGYITTAFDMGVLARRIMDQGRFKKIDSIRQCVERGNLFREHSGEGFL